MLGMLIFILFVGFISAILLSAMLTGRDDDL